MQPLHSFMHITTLSIFIVIVGCTKPPQIAETISTQQAPNQPIDTTPPKAIQTEATPSIEVTLPIRDEIHANVLSVDVLGDQGAYQFSVEIRSPDLGCEQYADWWEVLDEQGNLIYRRILTHSHVSEQPFTRSGGPVNISPETLVWVRAHMNIGGYGGAAMKGSVAAGFQLTELPSGFALDLAKTPPLPDGCAF